MSPWIPQHKPLDRLAWKVFPANIMYLFMVGTTIAIGLYFQLPWWAFAFVFVPVGVFYFVTCMYWGAYLLHPWEKPGDCTKWISFKNPSDEAKYKGKRIDIETMYEMYFDEKLDFKDVDLMNVFAQRNEFVTYTFGLTTHVWFLLSQWVPETLTHTKRQDESQVVDHYDRGNIVDVRDEAEDDFYGGFLGDRMVYTSGICLTGDESLEQMQDNKMNQVCNLVKMKKGDRHLDIGCGWGTLVNHSAKNFGSQSTGVTLAKNQVAYATNVSKKLGTEKNIRLLRMDYRDIPNEKFDKVTCLEMAEHVGVKNFQKFLCQVRELMEDDGIFYLQIAGLRRAFQYEDLVWGLFMAKYIFPGADASMPLGWVVGQLELAGFEIQSVDTIGVHYSLTIKKWFENWVKNKAKIVAKHGERWYRIFHLFLAWSTFISGTGGATCFMITCFKNRNAFDRRQMIANRLKGDNNKTTIDLNKKFK
uniref:sphingolipid C(9)-methyltransferase n=1 Tax=Hemiselmis andersenii TaxID=464988 RepID=A0A6U2BWE9_HEMAN|mmetsp:Transcript_18036/g.41746  ORF Transcript_18036/g.41746 Transcript_18036/m.41746 type:complete len:473 (-) Transcript_18036:367-1785(-)